MSLHFPTAIANVTAFWAMPLCSNTREVQALIITTKQEKKPTPTTVYFVIYCAERGLPSKGGKLFVHSHFWLRKGETHLELTHCTCQKCKELPKKSAVTLLVCFY